MDRRTKLLVGFSMTTVMALFVANIAAAKLWNLFGIAVDGGLLVFPMTYVVGDLMVEIYGEKTANKVSFWSAVISLIAILSLMLVVLLPAHPEYAEAGEAFGLTMGFSLRITTGSLIAYVLSRLTNNWDFIRVKRKQCANQRADWEDVRGYRVRELRSSMLGRLVDNIVFETIAFAGIASTGEFLKQMLMAYAEGLLVELVLIIFVTQPILNACRKYLNKS